MSDTKHELKQLDAEIKDVQDTKPTGDAPGVKRVAGVLPLTSYFIVTCEMAERFSFSGLALLLARYTQTYLGMDTSQSSALVRGFTFLCYFTSIILAVIADVWLGKYKTILYSCLWYMIGLIILATSAINLDFETPENNSGWHIIGFCLSLYVFIAFGTGGIKTNISTYLGEQIPQEDRPGKKPNTIIDYDMTVERAFQFMYWGVNVGATLGIVFCSLLYDKGMVFWSFALPALVFIISIASMILGNKRYINKPVQGNPLAKTIKCIWTGWKHRREVPEGGHFLDGAKGKSDLWDNRFITDLKRTLDGCKIFPFYIIYLALYNNIFDNFISVGLNMDRPGWLSPQLLNIVSNIIIIIMIPFCDQILYPTLRRFGFRMGLIDRILLGFFFCVIAFCYITVLQHFVYKQGPWYDFSTVPKSVKLPTNDISIFWQLPVYILIPFTEIFAAIGGNEFAFKYAAPELKSVVYALYLFMNCLGSLVGMILSIWSKHPNFVWLFGLECGLMTVATIIAFVFFRNLDEETAAKYKNIKE